MQLRVYPHAATLMGLLFLGVCTLTHAQNTLTDLEIHNFTLEGKPADWATFKAANDACASATTLTVDGGCTAYTTASHSLESGESTDCVTAGGGISLETTWLRFNTGTNTTLNLSWLYTNTINCLPGIVVWGPFTSGGGCLPSGTSVTCLNIQNGDPGYHTQLAGLTANMDYLIQLVGRNCGGGDDRFITGCAGIYSVPGNNVSGTSTLIDQCGLTFNGTNAGYTATGSGLGNANLDNNAGTTCAACGTAGMDVNYAINNDSWFYFCAANAGTWNVQFDVGAGSCTLTGAGLQMSLFRGSPTALTEIEHAPSPSAAGSTWTSANFTVSAGECIYLIVDGFAGDICDYSYNLTNVSGGCVILDVEFLDFQVKDAGDKVALDWSVSSDFEADFYTIERSVDNLNFEPIFRMEASQNTSGITNYHALDDNAPQGMVYYRIMQTDINSNHSKSETRSIWVDKPADELLVSPNPADVGFVFEVKVPDAEELTTVLRDITGKEISRVQYQAEEGLNKLEFNTVDFEVGVYLFEVIGSQQHYASRIVIDR